MLELEIAGPVRDLTEDEVEARNAPVVLKRIRDSHLTVARLLAHGLTPIQVALQTGYAVSRISVLQRDPTFIELLDFFRLKEEEARSDFNARLQLVAEDATQELHERMQDAPETFSNAELLDVAKTYIDRAGFAPIQRSVTKTTVTHNIGERMDAAHKRLLDVTPAAPIEARRSSAVPIEERGFGRPDRRD